MKIALMVIIGIVSVLCAVMLVALTVLLAGVR